MAYDVVERIRRELEPEDGYPHPELYEWSENYIAAHCMSENCECKAFTGYELQFMNNFPWSRRYCSLVQHGQFYDNLGYLESIRCKYSIDEADAWKIELDLMQVPSAIANFEICYCYMRPARWFTYDWRMSDEPFPTKCEEKLWTFIDCMVKKISDESLPVCSAEEFIKWKPQ